MAETIGKAYVQVLPSTEKFGDTLKGNISPDAHEAGRDAGEKAGAGLVDTLKKVIIAAGIGKVIKDALTAGADLEQSIGGIETLFGDAAGKMQQYANEAYKTAGLSANEYMQQTTSFAASLLQSLEGDTQRAADAANQAVIDMADNANKMGTDIASIQNAYQGFAKGNFTMLDNLKLGYGGTKTEMERLLADAKELSGVDYNIENLSDIYSAINVIQTNLGITGTTAKEAASTFSGSLASMKSAWENVMATLSTGNGLDNAMSGLIESVSTFVIDNALPALTGVLTNIVPSITRAITALVPSLLNAIVAVLPPIVQGLLGAISGLIPTIIGVIPTIFTAIADMLPDMIDILTDSVTMLVESVAEVLPDVFTTILEMIPSLIDSLLNTFTENFPKLLDVGINLFSQLVEGLPTIITNITSKLPNIINKIASTLVANVDVIFDAGLRLFMALVEAIPDIIVALVENLPEIVKSVVDGLGKLKDKVITAGENLFEGLKEGIKNVIPKLIQAAKDAANKLIEAAKNVLGIHSPSRVFAEIGAFTMEGFAEGIEDNVKPVTDAIDEVAGLTATGFENELALSSSVANNSRIMADTSAQNILAEVAERLDRLAEMGVYLDSGALVGGIAEKMDNSLNVRYSRVARGGAL